MRFADMKDWMSPITWDGLRTFSPMSVNRSSFVHAGAGELHRRDLQALVEDLARAQAVAGAADIGDVADRADQRDDAAVAEHRA